MNAQRRSRKRSLRRVTYERALGRDKRRTESGTILSLLLRCPFFFLARLIPPRSVVNDFLQVAANDAGASGGEYRWEPFQIDSAEYELLASALKKRRFVAIPSPPWMKTYRDWGIWCCEAVWGVPALKRRRLARRMAAIESAMGRRGISNARVGKLLKRFMDLQMEDCRYFSQHRSSKPKLPLFKG